RPARPISTRVPRLVKKAMCVGTCGFPPSAVAAGLASLSSPTTGRFLPPRISNDVTAVMASPASAKITIGGATQNFILAALIALAISGDHPAVGFPKGADTAP